MQVAVSNHNSGGFAGRPSPGAEPGARLVLVKFKVGGNMRFLSHAETLKVFQRACVRAGMKVQYTQGFNPRPKLSLPLPRAVGVASDDELLCVRVDRNVSESRIKARLPEQLPAGFELASVRVAEVGLSFLPGSATYVLPVRHEYVTAELQARIERILASERLDLQRRIGPDVRGAKFKTVDVRSFLKSIELEADCIIVECNISSAGSIRIEEILRLLGLDMDKLAAPIKRTGIRWQEV
jgi:radical SAM-linked protein